MPKQPSLRKDDQIKYLAQKWGVTHDEAAQRLHDVRQMDIEGLSSGHRVYWDDFGTVHVQIKPPIRKKLPNRPLQTFPARLNVYFSESATFLASLRERFSDRLAAANAGYF